ncbi:MAG: hypothetical protein AAGL98_06115, partial [Planctomycetota bacterium]
FYAFGPDRPRPSPDQPFAPERLGRVRSGEYGGIVTLSSVINDIAVIPGRDATASRTTRSSASVISAGCDPFITQSVSGW